MILYHFCPARMVEGIREKGIILGKMPISFKGNRIMFVNNCQSLTLEPDPTKQSWATSILISYSRTAYRITVNIPRQSICNVIKAIGFVENFNIDKRLVTDWEGSENWYVYRGMIPAKWIVSIDKIE